MTVTGTDGSTVVVARDLVTALSDQSSVDNRDHSRAG